MLRWKSSLKRIKANKTEPEDATHDKVKDFLSQSENDESDDDDKVVEFQKKKVLVPGELKTQSQAIMN